MQLSGKITNVDLGFGIPKGVITTDDGKQFKFGTSDCGISVTDWKIGLRVSFEDTTKAGEAKHVKLFSTGATAAKPAVTVTIDSIKYVPFHVAGNNYSDGVEVFYTYRVNKGWKNSSMEFVPAESDDFQDDTKPEPGHADFGDSPTVSVFHPKSGVNSRFADIPKLVYDGEQHSAKAVVGFGKAESVKIGADVSVRVALRVTDGKPGVREEAIAEKMMPLAQKSQTPHQSTAKDDGPSGIDTSTGDWAKTAPSQ